MDTLRIGLIGCGGMALHLARQAREIEGVEISAVCDVDSERTASAVQEFSAEGFTDYREMIAQTRLDAVIIATPGVAHADPAVASAQAGLHIFCEKPMATTLEDCDRMIEAAEKAQVRLMIGQVLRYYPTFFKTQEIIASGYLGSPVVISVARTGGAGLFDRGWRTRFSDTGGILMEVNAHELDYMRYICGEARSVMAQSRKILPGPHDYPDLYFVEITFKSGALGVLHSSIADAIGRYQMSIQCTGGSLANDGFAGNLRYARFGEEKKTVPSEELQKEEPYHHELRLFIESIRNHQEPPVTGYDGRAAVELALAAYRSAETGEEVRLPL